MPKVITDEMYNRFSYMGVYTGKLVEPLHLADDDIDIKDIAHGLSLQCRYNGAVKNFYSVAEHCVLIADHLAETGYDYHVQLQGLLHDTAEAYMGDMIRPLKTQPEMILYKEIEARLEKQILKHFGCKEDLYPIVKELDNRICFDEMEQNTKFFNLHKAKMGDIWRPVGIKIQNWSPKGAEQYYLETFDHLMEAINGGE